MPIDITTTSRDALDPADLDFHPLVRARLKRELDTHSQALWSAPPDSIRVLQGRCEILRWILGEEGAGSGRPALLRDIIAAEREKAKAAEKAAEAGDQ